MSYAAREQERKETRVEDMSIAERIKVKRRRTASRSQDKNQDGKGSEQMVVTLDAVPIIITKKEHDTRLKSASLWLQHLRHLVSAGEMEEDALICAFDDYDRTWGMHWDGRTPAQGCLVKLCRSVEALRDALEQAVPFSRRSEALAELESLNEEIDEAEDENTAKQIRAFASRRLQNKDLSPVDRRKAFSQALYGIRCTPKHRPYSFKAGTNASNKLPDVSTRAMHIA